MPYLPPEDYLAIKRGSPFRQVYVLVSQDEPFIQKYRRSGDAWEQSDYHGLDSVLTVEAIEFASPLSEIYDGVTFETSREQ